MSKKAFIYVIIRTLGILANSCISESLQYGLIYVQTIGVNEVLNLNSLYGSIQLYKL